MALLAPANRTPPAANTSNDQLFFIEVTPLPGNVIGGASLVRLAPSLFIWTHGDEIGLPLFSM
jgi:hypothetical protein